MPNFFSRQTFFLLICHRKCQEHKSNQKRRKKKTQGCTIAAASLSKWRFLLNAWTGQKRNFGSFYRNSSQLLHCMRGGHDFGNLLMDFPSPKNPLKKEKKKSRERDLTIKLAKFSRFHFCHIHQKKFHGKFQIFFLSL